MDKEVVIYTFTEYTYEYYSAKTEGNPQIYAI